MLTQTERTPKPTLRPKWFNHILGWGEVAFTVTALIGIPVTRSYLGEKPPRSNVLQPLSPPIKDNRPPLSATNVLANGTPLREGEVVVKQKISQPERVSEPGVEVREGKQETYQLIDDADWILITEKCTQANGRRSCDIYPLYVPKAVYERIERGQIAVEKDIKNARPVDTMYARRVIKTEAAIANQQLAGKPAEFKKQESNPETKTFSIPIP